MHAVVGQGAYRYEHAMYEVWSVLAGPHPGGFDGESGSGYPPIPPRSLPSGGGDR